MPSQPTPSSAWSTTSGVVAGKNQKVMERLKNAWGFDKLKNFNSYKEGKKSVIVEKRK